MCRDRYTGVTRAYDVIFRQVETRQDQLEKLFQFPSNLNA